MNREVLVNRLALIKQLYTQGVQQSKNSEPLSSFAILSFHDSIEMFLKLLAEKENKKSEGINFMEFWNIIPNLTLRESCRALNARRVNFKHKGILPSKTDIDYAKIITMDFFEQNTRSHFDIEFKSISLINLVKYEPVRKHLEDAVGYLHNGKFCESIDESTFAFNQLVYIYEHTKKKYSSPLDFTYEMDRYNFDDNKDDRQVKDLRKRVKKTFREFNTVIKVIGLGIDFKKYIRFKMITPNVFMEQNGQFQTLNNDKDEQFLNHDNCQFLIDFTIESSLRIQDFDFDIQGE